jgi:hypothetical protein
MVSTNLSSFLQNSIRTFNFLRPLRSLDTSGFPFVSPCSKATKTRGIQQEFLLRKLSISRILIVYPPAHPPICKRLASYYRDVLDTRRETCTYPWRLLRVVCPRNTASSSTSSSPICFGLKPNNPDEGSWVLPNL